MEEPFPGSVVILGAAGGGKLAYWCLQAAHPGTRVIFVDDGMEENFLTVAGTEIPILHEWRFDRVQKAGGDEFRHFLVSCTYPRVKRALVTKALAAGLLPTESIIHPQAVLVGRPTISIGRGGFVHANSTIYNDTQIGDYVIVSSGAHVGHDCILEDFSSVNFGSTVLGTVHIKTGADLGAGTAVRDHVTIAPWVQTGMQACITKDVLEEGITVVGVPARPLVKTPPPERQR